MTTNIILFPGYEELKKEVDKLRAELSMLIYEYDELRFVECKNIEMVYMLSLGSIEYKAYEAECTYLRLKRKLELIQAKKNRQEPIVVSEIEEALDEEFDEYQKKLDEHISKMNDALDRGKFEQLSDEETKELKSIYHKVVKELHPDLNPEESQAKIELFEKAVEAYRNGDLFSLRLIHEMACESVLPDNSDDAVATLNKEKVRLKELLEKIMLNIENVKSEFPYTMKELINDPEQTRERRKQLEELIAQYNDMIKIYKVKIEEMIG